MQLRPIAAQNEQFAKDQLSRYFIYEIDDNEWQNVDPEGQTDYDLESIKQKPAELPVGILTVNADNGTFSFEGDLTITQEDQKLLFEALKVG